MERTQQDIEKDLADIIDQRKLVESRMENTQKELIRLQELLEGDFDNLKSKQNAENNYRTELYEVQKNSIKQAMSMDGIKKVLGDATPFFLKVKEKTLGKVQAMKDFLDGTSFDRKWVDEKYEEYKKVSINKGDEIKSKEEFEKIALAIKDSSETSNLSIYDRVSNISKEIGTAKTIIKNVWQSIGVEEKVVQLLQNNAEEETVEILDKKTVLNIWLTSEKVNLNSSHLYKQYTDFVKNTYGEDSFIDLAYKQGNFTAIINRKEKDNDQSSILKNIEVKKPKR